MLQFFQLISQQNEFPVTTVGVLAVNLLAFFSEYGQRLDQTCISAWHVLHDKEWRRLLLASYVHSHDYHLYYNMASFIWKALTLERHFGSGYLFYMIAVFSVLTNVVYVAISTSLAKLTGDYSYMYTCAVGFSGVIFALKVVTTHMQPYGMASLLGFISVPVKMAVWFELVLISVLFPNVSFVGHLAGVLVGVAYVRGPLKTLMDLPFTDLRWPSFGLGTRRYTYTARSTGHGIQRRRTPSSRRNDATRRGYHPEDLNDDADLQEAISRSLQDTSGPPGPLRPHQSTQEYQSSSTRNTYNENRDLSGDNLSPTQASGRSTRNFSTEELRAARLRRIGVTPH